MRATFVLGRIAGVRVGVHWSVLFIFGLIAFGLSQGRLPETYPGSAWAVYWAAGLVTAVIFFASLLAHELAHALVARRNGVEVDDIVLWLLGGAARLRSEASSPGAELRIAGIGPLVSLLLGGLFALATWLLDLASVSRVVVAMAAWLAGINATAVAPAGKHAGEGDGQGASAVARGVRRLVPLLVGRPRGPTSEPAAVRLVGSPGEPRGAAGTGAVPRPRESRSSWAVRRVPLPPGERPVRGSPSDHGRGPGRPRPGSRPGPPAGSAVPPARARRGTREGTAS